MTGTESDAGVDWLPVAEVFTEVTEGVTEGVSVSVTGVPVRGADSLPVKESVIGV